MLSVPRDIRGIRYAHEDTALLEEVFEKRKGENESGGVVHHSSGVDGDLLQQARCRADRLVDDTDQRRSWERGQTSSPSSSPPVSLGIPLKIESETSSLTCTIPGLFSCSSSVVLVFACDCILVKEDPGTFGSEAIFDDFAILERVM